MSLIRQIWALLAAVIVLAFTGSLAVSIGSARDYLQTQLTLKNNDTAQLLALTLSQQRGDPVLMDLSIASQFDTGYYERIRLVDERGTVLLDKRADRALLLAPAWFSGWLAIAPQPGVAQVSDGWRVVGSLEVRSQVGYAVDELWWGALGTASTLGLLGAAAAFAAAWGVRRIRRPLDAVVEQAESINQRRFVSVAEPGPPELRRVVQAMNAMVARLRGTFDEHAAEVQRLHLAARCDPLTGLAHRGHFMRRLQAVVQGEDGLPGGTLLLVRAGDLARLNHERGHRHTDDLLVALSRALARCVAVRPSAWAGRMNGTDFAWADAEGAAGEDEVRGLARQLRDAVPPELTLAIGAVAWHRGESASSAMAGADVMLARAEAEGRLLACDMGDAGDTAARGEDAWRERIEAALAGQALMLREQPVVNAAGQRLHQRCAVSLVDDATGSATLAAMAQRTGMAAALDLRGLTMVWNACLVDGRPRAIEVSMAGSSDPAVRSLLRERSQRDPQVAGLVTVELAAHAAARDVGAAADFVAQLNAWGCQAGIAQAGPETTQLGDVFQAGLHTVRLADDSAAAAVEHPETVAALVRMAHAFGVEVLAQAPASPAHEQALWKCGVDGLMRRPQ